MPVGFNSPARNFFLLGSSGADLVTNFFKTITSPDSASDAVYRAEEIRYDYNSDTYTLAGWGQDNNSTQYGWVENRNYNPETGGSTQTWRNIVRSSITNNDLRIKALEVDNGYGLVAVGIANDAPFIAKYDGNNGTLDFQSTSNSGNVIYSGIAVDINKNYYACGNTLVGDRVGFIEKYDSNGNPGWGKAASYELSDVRLEKIAVNSKGGVVAVGTVFDDAGTKGYIVKVDSLTGDVLWDKTLKRSVEDQVLNIVLPRGVFIDSEDFIYVVGWLDDITADKSFIIKYSPEGNLLWQRETDSTDGDPIQYYEVKADGNTGQVIVFGRYYDTFNNDEMGLLTKYSRNGDLVWRRTIKSSYNQSLKFGFEGGAGIALDFDESFYYLLFTDDVLNVAGRTPEGYTFGKVSSSGNGLGQFEYSDGVGETMTYTIIEIPDRIGRIQDGSVRIETSGLISYPFNANKLLFDDYATSLANKKRQLEDDNVFQYSGSPAIRPADFQELNLLGDTGFVEGPNLIFNGTFDGNIDGWNGTGISLLHNSFTTSWDSNGYLEVNSNTNVGSYYGISQDVPTIEGKIYKISLDVVSGSATSAAIRVQNGNLGINPLPTQTSLGVGSHEFYFTAGDQGFSKVFLGRAANVNGANNVIVLYDNIKVCEVSVVDQSGKGNDGVVNGPTHNAAGWWDFNGTPGLGDGDTINLGDTSTYNWIHDRSVSDWAIEGWFWNDRDEEYGALISNNSGTAAVGFYMGQRNDSQFECVINKGTQGTQACRVLSTNILDHNRWYHIVFVNENYTIKMYVDGVLQSNGGDQNSFATGSTANAQTDLRIGKTATSPTWNLDGRIGEVRIYKDRSLTAAQVFQNYNATKSKYINEAPDTAPKIGPGIVYDSNLLLNYDFGNRATYDRAENLITWSEEITNAAWTKVAVNIDPNSTVSPDGLKTADKIYDDTTSGTQHYTTQSFSKEATTYTGSVYVKAAEYTKLAVGFTGVANWQGIPQALFDLVSEEAALLGADTTATINSVGNGWYRVSITSTSLNTTASALTLSHVSDSGTNTGGGNIFLGHDGDGVSGLYIWGAQVEKGSTPGRYIKTSGTAITAPTTVKNLSSSSYTGTINGATFNPAGYFEFDGVDDRLSNFDVLLSQTNGWTCELWFRGPDPVNDNTASTWNYLFTDAEPGGPFWECGMYSNGLTFSMKDNTIPSNQTAVEFSLTQNQWHYLAFGLTSTGETFLTGSDASGNLSTDLPGVAATSGACRIVNLFSNDAGNNLLAGHCGEIRLYDKELTLAERTQNFNATRSKYGV